MLKCKNTIKIPRFSRICKKKTIDLILLAVAICTNILRPHPFNRKCKYELHFDNYGITTTKSYRFCKTSA